MLMKAENVKGTTTQEGEDVVALGTDALQNDDLAVQSSHKTNTLVNVPIAAVSDADPLIVLWMI